MSDYPKHGWDSEEGVDEPVLPGQFNARVQGQWASSQPKIRRNNQWIPIAEATIPPSEPPEGLDGGFSWDQTSTDTDWLYDADAAGNLNVETVTTLDYSGTGSVTEAVSNAAGDPTVIVFEVGGQIQIGGDRFQIDTPNLWFAGETAPWPGITFSEGRVRTREPNLIFSHISFISGDRGVSEAKTNFTAEDPDTMVDHCTFALSASSNLSWHGGTDRASVINCIIAEGLYRHTFHDQARSRGLLDLMDDQAGAENQDFTHLGCIYAHHVRRMPLMRAHCCMANNYIYNYGHNVDGYTGSGSGGNIVVSPSGPSGQTTNPEITWQSCVYEPGDSTPSGYSREIFSFDAQLYHDDIEWDDENRPLTDNNQTILAEPPTVPAGLDLENDLVPASGVIDYVKANSGPRPADRPDYEYELVNSRLQTGSGVIDEVSDLENAGWTTPWDYTGTSHSLNVPSTDIIDWIKTNYTAVVEGTA